MQKRKKAVLLEQQSTNATEWLLWNGTFTGFYNHTSAIPRQISSLHSIVSLGKQYLLDVFTDFILILINKVILYFMAGFDVEDF